VNSGAAVARKRPRDVEGPRQRAFFEAVGHFLRLDPRWDGIHAIPNGHKRSKSDAAKIKAEGGRAGVWDIFLPFPTKGAAGLYLEYKGADDSTLSEEQRTFAKLLAPRGYRFAIVRDAKEGVEAVRRYLETGLGTYHGGTGRKLKTRDAEIELDERNVDGSKAAILYKYDPQLVTIKGVGCTDQPKPE